MKDRLIWGSVVMLFFPGIPLGLIIILSMLGGSFWQSRLDLQLVLLFEMIVMFSFGWYIGEDSKVSKSQPSETALKKDI
jgi:hypothetical protein